MKTSRIIILTLTLSLFPAAFLAAQEHENFIHNDFASTMQPADRAALLLVHFGTTYDDARTRSIDAVNAKAAEAFPQLSVREAWTSRIIIRKLRQRGEEKQTPLEALLRLRAEGFTHVVVQSTTLLDGAEMESLRQDVACVEPFFKDIRVGTPLLFSVEDCRKVAEILAARHESCANARKKAHVVLVGHGTYTPATATYSQMDHIMKAEGHKLFHVTTLEGYPTYDTTLAELKTAGARSVTLVPFLFLAGDHANNDISVEWKEAFEAEGFQTGCTMEGLGEIPEIQEIYIEKIRFTLHHKEEDIMKKKQDYADGEDNLKLF